MMINKSKQVVASSDDVIKTIDSITIDVTTESGEKQSINYKFKDGEIDKQYLTLEFDCVLKTATLHFNYSAYELSIIKKVEEDNAGK